MVVYVILFVVGLLAIIAIWLLRTRPFPRNKREDGNRDDAEIPIVPIVRHVTDACCYVLSSIFGSITIEKIVLIIKNRGLTVSVVFNGSTYDRAALIFGFFIFLIYAVCIIYATHKIKHEEISKGTISNVVTEVVARVGNHNSSNLVNSLLPELKENIDNLHILDAGKILKKIREALCDEEVPDMYLLAKIDFLIGNCSKYEDWSSCHKAFVDAYDELKQCGKFDKDIYSTRIFVACKDNDSQLAYKITKELERRNLNSVWAKIPYIFFSNDRIGDISSYSEPNKEYIYATLAVDLGVDDVLKVVNVNEYAIPELDGITFENFVLWPFCLSVLLARFVRKWRYINNGVMPNKTVESEDLYNFATKYYEALAKTQLSNPLKDLDFIYTFLSFIHEKSPHLLDKMGSSIFTDQMKDVYFISYSSMFIAVGETEKALNLLSSYGEDANVYILQLRLKIALDAENVEEIKNVFQFTINHNIELENEGLDFYVACLHWHTDVVESYIPQMNIIDLTVKRVVMEIRNHFTNSDVDLNYVISKEGEIPSILIPYVAMIYNRANKTADAIRLLEPILPVDCFDIRTNTYIELLESDIKYSSRLYRYLGEMRQHNLADDNLLRKELNMAETLMDFERCLTITTILYNNNPNDGLIIEHYLMALYRMGRGDKIEGLYPMINAIGFQESSIKNIFNIFLFIGDPEKALEFLYNEISTSNSQRLRDFYIEAHLNKSIGEIIMKDYEVVCADSYVLINVDGKEEYTVIQDGSNYEALIGKKYGETIKIRLPYRTMTIFIKAIRNKYFRLYKEIMADVRRNKSKSITAFSVNDLNVEDPVAPLNMFFTKSREIGDNIEREKVRYQQGNLSLYSLIDESRPFSDLFDHLFGDFAIYTIPLATIRQVFLNTKYDILNATPVLDPSGLIMMQELSARFSLTFDRKFIVPHLLRVAIQDAATREKYGLPSSVNKKTIDKMTFPKNKQHPNSVLLKLQMIDDWITNFCVVESDDKTLDVNLRFVPNDMSFLQFLCVLMIANNPDRVLISEDLVSASLTRSISASNWLGVRGYKESYEIQGFIVGCHYTNV